MIRQVCGHDKSKQQDTVQSNTDARDIGTFTVDKDTISDRNQFVLAVQSIWFTSWSRDDVVEAQQSDNTVRKRIQLKQERNDPPDKDFLKSVGEDVVILCQKWNNLEVHNGIFCIGDVLLKIVVILNVCNLFYHKS